MSELPKRVASAVVLGLLFFAAAWLGGAAFLIILCAASCVIWFEWSGIRIPDLDDRLLLLGVCVLLGVALVLWLAPHWLAWLATIGLLLTFSVTAMKLEQLQAVKGLLYAATLLVSLGHLRGDGDHAAGFVAICFLCAVVFSTDIGAYFVGRWIGGPKLSPGISPNKTISGALGGLIAAVIFASLTYAAFGRSPVWVAALLAIPLSVASQFGDLYESWMKRGAGVKDSGKLIPGHGGVMDRVDGLLFAAFGLWFSGVVAGHWREPANVFFNVG
ncbi:MAG: phosphatidate cytidylyltransferase [Pseudomonadota bacterium]